MEQPALLGQPGKLGQILVVNTPTGYSVGCTEPRANCTPTCSQPRYTIFPPQDRNTYSPAFSVNCAPAVVK